MIRNLHLALSDRCGGNCIFCPKHENDFPLSNMDFKLAKKIIDEISSEEFKKVHDLREIQVGSNGDCFFNPDLLKILRYLKSKELKAEVVMFTNFQIFNAEKSDIIIKEKLVDRISCNIDSMSGDYYKFIKKLDLENALTNLGDFMIARKKYKANVPLTIYVINIFDYVNKLNLLFKSIPNKVPNDNILKQLKNDYDFTNQALLRIINKNKGDSIKNLQPIFWAERKTLSKVIIDYNDSYCPQLIGLQMSFFIAPGGQAYLCCLDNEYKLTYGNVKLDSLVNLYECDKRKELIRKLENKEFKEIGLPCSAVHVCHSYDLNEIREREKNGKD